MAKLNNYSPWLDAGEFMCHFLLTLTVIAIFLGLPCWFLINLVTTHGVWYVLLAIPYLYLLLVGMFWLRDRY